MPYDEKLDDANPYVPPTAVPRSRGPKPVHRQSTWLSGLCMLQGVVLVFGIAAEAYDIETIVLSGPIFALLGFGIAVIGKRHRDIPTATFGTSAVAFALLIVFLINYCDWGPSDADGPVRLLSFTYAICAFPLAMWLFYRRSISGAFTKEEPSNAPKYSKTVFDDGGSSARTR